MRENLFPALKRPDCQGNILKNAADETEIALYFNYLDKIRATFSPFVQHAPARRVMTFLRILIPL